MFYKTTANVQLWTNAENKAGKTAVGVIVEIGQDRVIKEHQCALVLSDNYKDEWLETDAGGLEVYVSDPGQGSPVVEVTRVEGTVNGAPFVWPS